MYKLIDLHDGTIHKMNEKEIKTYLKTELDINETEELEIEKIVEILHSQGYELQYS